MGMPQPFLPGFAATNRFLPGSVPNQHFSSGRSQRNNSMGFAATNSYPTGFVPNQPQQPFGHPFEQNAPVPENRLRCNTPSVSATG
jgi:hypothetical protein